MKRKSMRLVVVSNRLPVNLERNGKDITVELGQGGLVTALAPVLRSRGGDWIGWAGTTGDEELQPYLDAFSKKAGYNLRAVALTKKDEDLYYKGFSNEVLWPLFHDFHSRCNFAPEFFAAYLDVNRKFAQAVESNSTQDDYIWVHDYHLMHVAWWLGQMGIRRRCGFFLHIPFPSPDIFLKLPWRKKIIKALLEFEMVGFQTFRDRRNFVQCVKTLTSDVTISGRGPVVTAIAGSRRTRIGYFPISIDFKEFSDAARTKEAACQAAKVKTAFKRRTIIFGADRLDYSKGIPERIEAVRYLLRNYPEMREKVTLIQVVVPSRESVEGYSEKKRLIEVLLSEVNGEFSTPGWVPIHYLYRNLSREELLTYYRAADIGLVTPLRDGMNLVAKEFCACNVRGEGVLVLSEFAGAAAQLQRGALLVNPHDVEAVADALYTAYHMPEEERRNRMHKMRSSIRKHDIYWWVDAFLQAGFGARLNDLLNLEGVDYHRED